MSTVLARLRSDLVERRLWPIVLLLVLALVAVPLLLTHSAPTPPTTPKVTPSPEAASAVTAAERAISARPPKTPAGPSRDPFPAGSSKKPASGAAATASGAGSAPPASHPSPSSGSGSASSGSSSSPGSPAPSPGSPAPSSGSSKPPASATVTPIPKPRAATPSRPAHRTAPQHWTIRYVDLRVGAGPQAAVRRGVARLAPLPSGRAPLALMLGVLRDGRSVAFRIGQGVTVIGQGRCVPGKSVCTQLVLRPGQHVDLTPPGGTALRLRVVAVRSARTTSRARALQAYERVSPTGRCILDALDAFDYDAQTGALHRAGPRHRCRYTTPAGGSGQPMQALR